MAVLGMLRGLGGISPEWEALRKKFGGDQQADPNQPLPTGEEDDVLKGLAAQTIQPYRPGWAALPGVASSIVGGMAAARLRSNAQQRQAADNAAWGNYSKAMMGPGMAGPIASTAPQPTAQPPVMGMAGGPRTSQPQPTLQQEMAQLGPMLNPAAPRGMAAPLTVGPPASSAPAPAVQGMAGDPRLSRYEREMQALSPMLQNPGTRAFAIQRMQAIDAARSRIEDPDNALDRRYKEAQIKKIETDNKSPQAVMQQRMVEAKALGLDENSEPFKRYVLTGQVAPGALSQSQSADGIAQGITGGIETLASIPGRYSDFTFENAVGPLQGDDKAGLFGTVARAWGSFRNAFGSSSTSEIRNRIAGDTEALAAAIKPLIRKPGEGPWSDADQARLVAVVGNLAMARTKEEYMRALEGVRQRVMQNFGIQLPPIGGAPSGPQPGTVEDGYRFKGGDPSKPESWEQVR